MGAVRFRRHVWRYLFALTLTTADSGKDNFHSGFLRDSTQLGVAGSGNTRSLGVCLRVGTGLFSLTQNLGPNRLLLTLSRVLSSIHSFTDDYSLSWLPLNGVLAKHFRVSLAPTARLPKD